MSRRLRLIGAALLIVSLSSLVALNQNSAEEEKHMNANWTESQRNILESYGTTPSRIESGVLTPAEERLMNVALLMEDYLARRYPEHTFTFVSVGGSMLAQSTITLQVTDENGTAFSVRATAQDEERTQWMIEDQYYALVKAADTANDIAGMLEQEGVSPVKATARLVGFYGEDYDLSATVEELAARGLTLAVSCEAYTDTKADLSALVSGLEAALRNRGFTGGISLVALDALPDGPADRTWLMVYREQIREKVFVGLTVDADPAEATEE